MIERYDDPASEAQLALSIRMEVVGLQWEQVVEAMRVAMETMAEVCRRVVEALRERLRPLLVWFANLRRWKMYWLLRHWWIPMPLAWWVSRVWPEWALLRLM